MEEVVGSQEGVFDCAVIGLPDEKWGERVTVIVIRKPGLTGKDISEQDIINCCKDKIASYKRPKEIIFIEPEDMPRTGTGKILHRILRDKFGK